jgi:CBS domain-containing protein
MPSKLTARDLMQTDVLSVTPETPLVDVHRLFLEEEIHGAPVIDDSGRVRGVISSNDLLRAVLDAEDGTTRHTEMIAEDIMARELVSIPSNTPVAEIARVMRGQRIHRVLVIDDGELLGLVTTFDLMRAFDDAAPALPPIPRQAGDAIC